nr:reverse transcriptase domain-containing protein [Tanacetum cinerariifolium]
MHTRRSYFPPTSTIPRRSRKQTTNVVEPEFRTIVEMADNRTMAQMLQAPIEGYEDAIFVPQINANNFELKHTLINLVQSNQFTGRQDPHNHLHFFNKVTSTFRHPEVPNTTIKLLLFPFSLEGEAQIWLDKEPPRSILTWEDLVNPTKRLMKRGNDLRICLEPPIPPMGVEQQESIEETTDTELPSTEDLQPPLVQVEVQVDKPIEEPSVKVEQINKIDFINAGGIDFESEEIENFLNDDSIPFGVEDSPFNMDEDILFLESLLREDLIPPHPIISNQTKLPIEEPKHSFKIGNEHFNTSLVTKDVVESSTKNLIPIPHECKINSDEINSHAGSNSDESTSNHDTVKSDYLDEFYGPFIPEEERIRREHADYINRMEMLFTINPRPHHPKNVESFSSLPIPIQESDPRQEEMDVVSVTNDVLPPSDDDSDEEVNAVGDLRVDNFIQNSEHEYFESEDSDFDNPLLPLPPPEPPDKEFDFEINFEKEISVVRNVIVKFECINARVKFDVFNDENDVLSYFMFVIFDKEFSLLSAKSEDTIFDPEETRSGNTTHANYSLPEYDSFFFEIEPNQERLINLVKNDILNNLSNDSLLEEVDLFLFDNLIPLGIENVADDPEGDIHFLEALLIDDSILSHESFDYNFKDNPSIPRPPPEPPDAETNTEDEIPVVMNDKDEDEDVDYSTFIFVIYPKMFPLLLSAKSEDTIFDPGISN